MMPEGKRKSATVYLAAAVFLTCHLTQTIDCYRLKKTERREGRKEAEAAKTIGVREGTIVFGRVFEKGSGLPAQDGIKKSNSSGEDEAAYQADSSGSPQTHSSSKEATAWDRMSPSLHCGADQLRFRAMGAGASQFTVEQDHGHSMPLSLVPSTCGYNMQRNSLALVMLVPFNGCNMVQEGGNYVLPMQWQGIPVSLWCPKPGDTTAMPTTPKKPAMPTTPKKPAMPQLPHFPHFPHYPPMFPPFPMLPYIPPFAVTTTAAPTTTTTTKSTSTTTKPATTAPPPVFPFPGLPPYPPFPPQQPPFPFMPMYPLPSFPFPFPFLPPPMPPLPTNPAAEPEMTTTQTTTPTTTTPTTTTTTTTTTVKTDPPVTSSQTTHTHLHGHYGPLPYPYHFGPLYPPSFPG